MPILGVIASSISGNLYSASFDSIATQTVGGGGASSITFSSIPSTYTHLQVRFITLQSSPQNVWMQFNGDTNTNYAWHEMYTNTDAGTVPMSQGTNSIYFKVGYIGTSTANYAGISVVDILDYANTNKAKTVQALAGSTVNSLTTEDYIMFRSGHWRNTNAITSITILPTSGNFTANSHFALYGIKVA